MNEAREEARRLLETASGTSLTLEDIKVSQIGDLSSSIAFKLAKEKGKSPKEIAIAIAGKIRPSGLIAGAEALNGYVNFRLDYGNFAKHVLESIILKEDAYGKPLVSPEEKIILEHTSVNPSGPIHVGRLRNSILGDSIRRILLFAGYEVETHYFVNDIGKQMATIAIGFREKLSPDEDVIEKYKKFKDKSDFQVFFEYVAANRKFESDQEFQSRVQQLIRDAESGNNEALNAITNVAERCLQGQKKIFEKLKITFDVFDFESNFVKDKSALKITESLEKYKQWKNSEIGSGLDLSEYGIEKGRSEERRVGKECRSRWSPYH